MMDYTYTTRNVTAGTRNDAGEMVLRQVGDITLTLAAMTRAEVDEWAFLADGLNTRGIDEETFRLTVNGWKVVHPEVGTAGMLFQGYGTRVHVEWYDAANDDFFSAAWVRNLRHGAAAVINARQHAGQGLPVDFVPEPVKAPAKPVWLPSGTRVSYHGTLAEKIRADLGWTEFRVYACNGDDNDWCECDRYELRGGAHNVTVALHVGLDHVTALDAEPAAV
jgi:hypothetical protein